MKILGKGRDSSESFPLNKSKYLTNIQIFGLRTFYEYLQRTTSNQNVCEYRNGKRRCSNSQGGQDFSIFPSSYSHRIVYFVLYHTPPPPALFLSTQFFGGLPRVGGYALVNLYLIVAIIITWYIRHNNTIVV